MPTLFAIPEVYFTAGLSNISFGLPARSFINRAFLTLALGDCLNYTRAYRAGLFNGSGAKAGCAWEQAHLTDKALLVIVGGTRPKSILI
jgi:hypothetical protein